MKKVFIAIMLLCAASLYAQKAVDLGLSVKWATMNIGADHPTGKGEYFYWGDTSPYYENKEYFDPNYKLTKNINGSQYDVARKLWGNKWRMPTADEFSELLSNCKIEYVKIGNRGVRKITGPNGNSIIMPDEIYWSASLSRENNYRTAYRMTLKRSSDWDKTIVNRDRMERNVVRPVLDFTANDFDYKVNEKEEYNQAPSFPGGDSAFGYYLRTNLRYPIQALNNGVQGIVIVSFDVEKDGSITDVKVVKSVDRNLDKEAVRLINNMPRWNRGIVNGQPVRRTLQKDIIFSLKTYL